VFQLRHAARSLSNLDIKVELRDGDALITPARQPDDIVSRGGAAECVKCSG
jgi:hypothetical protein